MAPPPAPKSAPRVSRPAARYRPGKAPLGVGADDYSDSDEDVGHHDDQTTQQSTAADISTGAAALLQAQNASRKTAGIIINEAGSSSKKLDLRLHSTPGQVKDDEDSSEYETDTDDDPAPARPVFGKPGTAAPPPAEDSGSSEYEADSSEESEEEPPKPLLKPLFVPKSARFTIPSTTTVTQPEEDPEAKEEAEAARRKKEAHDLAAATIQRSLLQSQHEANQNTEVDDTDGLDPEAEFEAWRQRELARLRRDRDAMLAKQAEQREIEEFKSLPEAEKERLGRERAAKLRAEKKEQRGSQGFMQKYYHKGSFFQDMDILKRDYSEKTEKEVDVSKLPKMMQRRGWGEKGRGKWTHLANEDTSKAAMRVDVPGGGSGGGRGCFVCGGDHLKRDCPKREGGEMGEGSGSNRQDVASGSRSWGEVKSASKEDRELEGERRNRSRSPRRDSSRRHEDRDGKDRATRSRRDNERSDDRDSQSRRSRDDRDRERHHRNEEDKHRHHSHRSHREEDRSHRSRDDHHKSRSRSDRHESDDRKHSHRHRDDEEDRHDRHKRRDRDGDRDRDHCRSGHSSSSTRHRDEESDRKRSRLDA